MKKVLFFLCIIGLNFSLISCSTDDYNIYMNAVEKSDQLESGEQSLNVYGTITFNEEKTDKLFESELLNKLSEEIKADIYTTFDKDKAVTKSYVEIMGKAFSSTAYWLGEDVYLEVGMIPGFIKMPTQKNEAEKNDERTSQHSMSKPIIDKWIEILKQEDVVLGENVIVDTIDGSVKAKHFTINISNEQLKQLIDYSKLQIINSLNNQKGEISKFINKEISPEEIKKIINGTEITNFLCDAYIDIDGYLVQQKIKMDCIFKEDTNNLFEKISLEIKISNWDYNKKISIDMPHFEDENVHEMNEINYIENFLKIN